MSDTPQPIADELWLPLKRRLERFQVLAVVSMVLMVVAALAMMSVWWTTGWVAFAGAPLGIAGLILGKLGLVGARRALAEMRLLIIEHHGVDPDLCRFEQGGRA
jgi:hypothetical protein